MFSNLSWYEIAIVLLVALFIFGDKLPKAIADGLRLLRNLRQMARNATADLSRELGTDIQLEDLHPKTFLRKHVLNDADEALIRPLKAVSEDLTRHTRDLERDLKEISRDARTLGGGAGRPPGSAATGSAPRALGERAGQQAAPTSRPATEPATAPDPRTAYDDVT